MVTYYGPTRERLRHRIKRKWRRIKAGQDPGPDSDPEEDAAAFNPNAEDEEGPGGGEEEEGGDDEEGFGGEDDDDDMPPRVQGRVGRGWEEADLCLSGMIIGPMETSRGAYRDG